MKMKIEDDKKRKKRWNKLMKVIYLNEKKNMCLNLAKKFCFSCKWFFFLLLLYVCLHVCMFDNFSVVFRKNEMNEMK